MLAGLARTGRRAALLQRAVHASGAALADGASAAGRKQAEAPVVFSRASEPLLLPPPTPAAALPPLPTVHLDMPCSISPAAAEGQESEGLRYFVLKEEPGVHPELTLLEQAVYGTPLPGPGSRPRYARVPPPGICNNLLTKAVEVRRSAHWFSSQARQSSRGRMETPRLACGACSRNCTHHYHASLSRIIITPFHTGPRHGDQISGACGSAAAERHPFGGTHAQGMQAGVAPQHSTSHHSTATASSTAERPAVPAHDNVPMLSTACAAQTGGQLPCRVPQQGRPFCAAFTPLCAVACLQALIQGLSKADELGAALPVRCSAGAGLR